MKTITIPNSTSMFFIEEMHSRFDQGYPVIMAFGGSSMEPMIDGRSDRIELVAVREPLKEGEIYLFFYRGCCVIHRLLHIRDNELVFRGDNCRGEEHVTPDAVQARLSALIHADGSREECDSEAWKRRSRRVSARRSLKNLPFKLFGRNGRRWQRWVYFACLLLLMWGPVGALGLQLNNFVFGLRLDHLLHASVYLPCAFYLMDFGFLGRLRHAPWLFGLLVAAVTESVQFLLPYRGFDINDLVANFLGVTVGWLVFYAMKLKFR